MTHALLANLVGETSGGWLDLVFRGTLATSLAKRKCESPMAT